MIIDRVHCRVGSLEILIFCIVAAIQNQSRAYNVQAEHKQHIVAALWATERQV